MAEPAAGDDGLVRRAAAGSQAAWAALADRHLPAIHAFAWRRLGDRMEAEDVAQETMLRLSRKAPSWEPGGTRLRTWLFRVAHNLCIDKLRARRAHAPLDDADVVDLRPRLDRSLDAGRATRRALAALPQRQQAVLVLVYCHGYKTKEAAEILRISEHAAESLLARARRAMRAILEPQRADLVGARR